jgi:hypothetical protein
LNIDKIFQGGISQKLRRRSDINHLIGFGREPGPLDLHPMNEGSTEERNRTILLDMSVKNQQMLDLEVSEKDLNIVCVGE